MDRCASVTEVGGVGVDDAGKAIAFNQLFFRRAASRIAQGVDDKTRSLLQIQVSEFEMEKWRGGRDSNPRPPA